MHSAHSSDASKSSPSCNTTGERRVRLPIGQLMVERGVITREQCERVLEKQRTTHRPFGEICEELLDVRAKDVERAWSEQYAATTRWVDPTSEALDAGVRELINRRQAWQFRILPMGYDGNELMLCTTQDGLVRAMNFATRQIPVNCYFVLAPLDKLGEALMRHYPMEGMSSEALRVDPENPQRPSALPAAPAMLSGLRVSMR